MFTLPQTETNIITRQSSCVTARGVPSTLPAFLDLDLDMGGGPRTLTRGPSGPWPGGPPDLDLGGPGPWPGGAPLEPWPRAPLWTDRNTKNITFPQTSFAGGKYGLYRIVWKYSYFTEAGNNADSKSACVYTFYLYLCRSVSVMGSVNAPLMWKVISNILQCQSFQNFTIQSNPRNRRGCCWWFVLSKWSAIIKRRVFSVIHRNIKM